ncbi:type 1 fimbrial protein [Pseudomonas fakonensis]|uniref:Type 1 fimbrial protein n=1 Tax=Pseudomonas fakonensis TaxID=2842355 RepID=A0ABX8N4V8_9PSED|nr:fimbrial protein [Pseudomonas fakonensis]QXH50713.1 type 1 fimbrial protein [Pseudomonas fakonensis]
MRSYYKRMVRCGLAVLLWGPLNAWACNFPAGFLFRQEVHPGDLYVGRDVPEGAVIKAWTFESARFNPTHIGCPVGSFFTVGTPLAKIVNSPLVPPGEVILQSRIPGIGIVVSAHMTGGSFLDHWSFVPAQGYQGFGVPHSVTFVGTPTDPRNANIISTRLYYRIIKIGPIEPDMGPQPLAGHTLAEFNHAGSGKVLEMVLASGSINVAMCGLPGAPGTQVTVPMGAWRTNQFSGEGSYTDAKAFIVPLQACQGGSLPGNQQFAHLRLDPRNGSSVLDAQRGLLGLNSDSDAKGVAVQVLKADLTPMPLTQEVQMVRMQNGDIQIPMGARYIQTGKDAPVGGVANASVGFTLTYK